jgi:hypothetical protein
LEFNGFVIIKNGSGDFIKYQTHSNGTRQNPIVSPTKTETQSANISIQIESNENSNKKLHYYLNEGFCACLSKKAMEKASQYNSVF